MISDSLIASEAPTLASLFLDIWTLSDAVALCREVEKICPAFGCHVALTGGCLYKDGGRKDCDLLFYRIRQSTINHAGLWKSLREIGLEQLKDTGPSWCCKAHYHGRNVDCFFPEDGGLQY